MSPLVLQKTYFLIVSVNLKSGDVMLVSTIYDEDLAKVTFMLLPFLFRKYSMFMPSPSI